MRFLAFGWNRLKRPVPNKITITVKSKLPTVVTKRPILIRFFHIFTFLLHLHECSYIASLEFKAMSYTSSSLSTGPSTSSPAQTQTPFYLVSVSLPWFGDLLLFLLFSLLIPSTYNKFFLSLFHFVLITFNRNPPLHNFSQHFFK